jgi:hypothetical protein
MANRSLGAAIVGTVVGVAVVTAATVEAVNIAKSYIQAPASVAYNQNAITYYPHDLQNNKGTTFGMIFNFYSYDRPSIYNPPNLNPIGSIVLPLPSELTDKSSLDYSTDNSESIIGAATNLAAGKKTVNAENTAKAVGIGLAAAAQGGISAIVNKLAGSDVSGKVLQLAGVAQNPFLTVLFKAPTFKRHTFNWQFIPENSQDTETLKFILNKLRYHSLPDMTGGIYLTYPDMVKPVIFPRGYMYDFKHCVIESIQINYAPGDTPSFHAGINAPNAINLTISFLEIEYWLKGDIVGMSTGTNPTANS